MIKVDGQVARIQTKKLLTSSTQQLYGKNLPKGVEEAEYYMDLHPDDREDDTGSKSAKLVYFGTCTWPRGKTQAIGLVAIPDKQGKSRYRRTGLFKSENVNLWTTAPTQEIEPI